MVTCKTFQPVTSVYINSISKIVFHVQLHREAFEIIDSLAFQMHRAIWVLQYRNLSIAPFYLGVGNIAI